MASALRTTVALAVGGALIAGSVGLLVWGGARDRRHDDAAAAAPGKTDKRPEHPPQVYPTELDPRFHAGMPLRPMDIEVFKVIADARYDRKTMNDLWPERPYRVKLVGDPLGHTVYDVMIDMDRDGKWDETWRLKPEEVIRRVTVGGDPGTDVPMQMRGGRWMPY